MDNAPTHSSGELKSDDGKITCLFLPTYTTPFIQPMDQSIIEYMKRLIESLLSSDNVMDIKEFWKSYNIKDVYNIKDFNVTRVWDDLTVSNLISG